MRPWSFPVNFEKSLRKLSYRTLSGGCSRIYIIYKTLFKTYLYELWLLSTLSFSRFIEIFSWVLFRDLLSSNAYKNTEALNRSFFFCKKAVLKNHAKLTGKHLDWNNFKMNFQAYFMRLQQRCWVNVATFFQICFFIEHH